MQQSQFEDKMMLEFSLRLNSTTKLTTVKRKRCLMVKLDFKTELVSNHTENNLRTTFAANTLENDFKQYTSAGLLPSYLSFLWNLFRKIALE